MRIAQHALVILAFFPIGGACSLTMSPEQVAASYIQLIIVGNDHAAIALLEEGCPVVHKTGYTGATTVSGTVDVSTEDMVTVKVQIQGTLADGSVSQSSSKLNLVKQDELWLVKCPVAVTQSG